jgi:DNA repair protein RadC
MFMSSREPVPQARRDPITSPELAMSVFRFAMCRPLHDETLIMFLDDQSRGHELVSVSDTVDPWQVVDIADTMAFCAAGNADISALVVASVRPGGGPLPDDEHRWYEIAEVIEEQGLTLIDWLIIGRGGVHSPRDYLGIPSRWAA